ncbi:MAG: T9SS type A sorting domain-containing protein [Bacteroidetes bacterium]|nr:T9SS type A sorting domain-containing protein [Bacteroidota bacterium]
MTKIYKSILSLALLFAGVKSNAQVSAYSFSQLAGTYNAIPISGPTTTAIAVGNFDDNVFANIPIGFNFNFNNTTYSSIALNVNGWICMGTVTPFSSYTPISTGSFNDVVSFFGKDLQLGPAQTCTTTSGSNVINLTYPAANAFSVGDTLFGTGIPLNASVTAISAGNMTISANATAAGTSVYNKGSISYQVSGVTPNQVFTIQWRRVGRWSNTSTGLDDYMNVQIKLYQTTNVVEIIYGNCGTNNITAFAGEVGLRGLSNADFNNRSVTTSYAASTPGAVNSAVANFSAGLAPTSGQIYRWTPPTSCAGFPSAGSVSASQTICPNTTAVVSNTSSNSFTGIVYQWLQAPAAVGPWSNVTTGSGFNTQVLTTASLTTLTFYKLVITCTNSAQSVTTTVTSVNPNNPATLCYCNTNLGGSGCSGDNITNVTIFGTPLNNNSTCNSNAVNGTYTQFPPGPTTTATLNVGLTYTISVNTTANNIESVWIDYNQSGTFDVSEHTQICLTSIANNATQATFTVPATALFGQTGMRVRSRATGNPNGPPDACTSFGSGEAEDYIVTIAAAAPCAGTPGANSAIASLTTVCPNGTQTLSLANSYTVGGLTYQWSSAPAAAGPYTAITGATTSVFGLTNITTTLFYRAVITCTNGPASTTSTPVQIVVTSNPCQCSAYCASNATSVSNDEIFNVSIGTLNNTSNCSQTGGPGSILNEYSNYSGLIAAPTLTAGSTYTLNVTVGMCGAFGNSGIVTAYMDFNNNGSFTDPGETVYTSSYTPFAVTGTTVTATVTIPPTASPGITRMRIVEVESSIAQPPCGTYFAGETEDYCINIGAAAPCAGAPAANSALATQTNVCPNGSSNLSLSTSYTVGGLTYQWSTAPAAAGPYTAITGATLSTYSATNITTSLFYRAVITCTNGPASTTSTPVQILVGGSPCQCAAYCASNATSTFDDEIFNVSIGTLNNSSTCGMTGGPTSTLNLYSNYAGIIASPNLAAGLNYTLSMTVGECNGNSYSGIVEAYMDFNQNGSFADPGELVYSSPYGPFAVVGTTFTTVVTIPANATLGTTRMRIIADESSVSPGTCSPYTWGETEDYCITITPATPCAGAPAANSAVASATQVCTGGFSNLSLATSYTVGGLTYQWFSAPALAGPYTAIASATAAIYTATNITAATFYKAVITCTNGPASTTATPVQVVILGAPVYATVPFLENFDNTWQNRCDNHNVPVAANWDSNPTTGNQSWRRQDDGATALWSSTFGTVTPLAGAGCANFHSYDVFSPNTGNLDLYVNMNLSSTYTVSFYYKNSSGSDSLQVFFSNNGGATYTYKSTYTVDAIWNKKTILLPAVSSSSCVLRFLATGDFGADDIGIDSLQIQSACAAPNVTLAASQTTICSGTPVTLTASGATTYTWNTTATTSSISVTPSVTTSYTVIGENTPGCPNTKTVSITVKPSPTLSVSAAPTLSLCPGMSTTLTAVSSAGNYTWAPGGQTTSAISVTPAISTVYNVATTNSVGCVTNSNVTVFVVVCTGLAKNTVIDNNTFIYPNPNSGNVNVVIENSNGSYIFEVMDLSGRLVYRTTLNKSESAVNIKELANGMYTYKVTSLTTKVAIKEGKLIKE